MGFGPFSFRLQNGNAGVSVRVPRAPPEALQAHPAAGAVEQSEMKWAVAEQGDPIHGWLAAPEGEGPFPTILETHGGPTSVETLRFSPSAQARLDHGFAYCTVNYHGSVTFGREFEKSIWGNLEELEVQDMAGAWRRLVSFS
jgi:dipeptidyl aminopeptidase/acylaminoacyl peptidase